MRNRLVILAAALVLSLALAGAAASNAFAAPSPGAVSAAIRACLARAGATRFEFEPVSTDPTSTESGEVAFFGRPYSVFGSWVGWIELVGKGRVLVAATSGHLTRTQKTAANRCLKPFDTKV
jgi:hypothetical protein